VIGLIFFAAVAQWIHLRSTYFYSRELFKQAALEGKPVNAGGSAETLEVHRQAKAKLEGLRKNSSSKKTKKKEKKGEYSPEFEAAVEEAIAELEEATGQGPPTYMDTFLFKLYSGARSLGSAKSAKQAEGAAEGQDAGPKDKAE